MIGDNEHLSNKHNSVKRIRDGQHFLFHLQVPALGLRQRSAGKRNRFATLKESLSNAILTGIVLKGQEVSGVIVDQHKCCRDSLLHRVKRFLLGSRPVPRNVLLQQVEEYGDIWQEFCQIVRHP